MTIAELIEKLQQLDPTNIVAVCAYGTRSEPWLEVDDLTTYWVQPSENVWGLLPSYAENENAAECVVLS